MRYAGIQQHFKSFSTQQLSGEVLEGQLAYWREQLDGVEVLELPTDHPWPAISAGQGASLGLEFSAELMQQLKQLSLDQEVSLFMLLLSAWQVLLSRYTGQVDIVVGAPIANRTQGETEDLIGFFVNTLAFRSDLSYRSGFSVYPVIDDEREQSRVRDCSDLLSRM